MGDGNILVQYSHDVLNIMLKEISDQHMPEIERNHQNAIATDEVLITPMEPNKFDDFGKKPWLVAAICLWMPKRPR